MFWANAESDFGAVGANLLGGTAFSRPNCIPTAPDTIDCFYRGENNSVFQQSIVTGEALELVNIGGESYGNVQCVKLTKSSIACFTRGKQNYVSFAIRSGGTWGEWSSNTDAKVSEIGRHSCSPRSSGRCNCVFRVEKDQIARFALKDGTFNLIPDSATATLTYHSSLSCATLQGNSLECFGLKFDNTLLTYVRNKGTRKEQVPQTEINVQTQQYLFSHPSIATRPKQPFVHVFGIAEENKPVHIMYNKTHAFHSDSVVIGNTTMVESPECVATQTKAVFCFALSSDSALYMAKFDGESWSEWSWIASSFLENPSCVLWNNGSKISCFLRSFQRSLVKLEISISDISSST